MEAKIAVSSLIYAAARCGELPELNKLRSLFKDWYGNEFDAANVNLLSKNLVKSELQRTLSAGKISEDAKLELINDIAREYFVIRYPPRTYQQVRIESK